VVAIAPFAIVAGAAAAVGLLFFAFWDRLSVRLRGWTRVFGPDLVRADLKISSEQIVLGIAGSAVTVWLFVVVLLRPSVPLAILLLAVVGAVVTLMFRSWLKGRVKKRLKVFNNQLEMVLRMIGSGLRVGLGLRQALVLVTEDVDDPARSEFARVIGQTNIGVALNDALDALVTRMPSEELRMMVDGIKVQSQTGGNLAKILDHIAATIKSRRQIARKVRTLTGEARAGAWVIGALPIFVGGFVMMTQPTMREEMLFTLIGHIGLGLFTVLELAGLLSLRQMLQFEV